MRREKHSVRMLRHLTSAYNRQDIEEIKKDRQPQTNIGRLFLVFGWGLDYAEDTANKVLLWDDLDNTCGQPLDRYGMNFGVRREGASDELYRLMIQVKRIAQITGGDTDTIIMAGANMFGVETSEVELVDVFPAKIHFFVQYAALSNYRYEMAPLIAAMLKRLAAAGVGVIVIIYSSSVSNGEFFLGGAPVQEHIRERLESIDVNMPPAIAGEISAGGMPVYEKISEHLKGV